MDSIDIPEETEIALKDAYWGEVRKLYDAYLHAIAIGDVKQQQIDAAAERFKKGLMQAQSALSDCRRLSAEIPQAASPSALQSKMPLPG